jgi:hypothetical protein
MSSELPIHLAITRVERAQLSLRVLLLTPDPAYHLRMHRALLDAARTQLAWMTLSNLPEEPLTPLEEQPDLSSELRVVYPEGWRRPLAVKLLQPGVPTLLMVRVRYDLL